MSRTTRITAVLALVAVALAAAVAGTAAAAATPSGPPKLVTPTTPPTPVPPPPPPPAPAQLVDALAHARLPRRRRRRALPPSARRPGIRLRRAPGPEVRVRPHGRDQRRPDQRLLVGRPEGLPGREGHARAALDAARRAGRPLRRRRPRPGRVHGHLDRRPRLAGDAGGRLPGHHDVGPRRRLRRGRRQQALRPRDLLQRRVGRRAGRAARRAARLGDRVRRPAHAERRRRRHVRRRPEGDRASLGRFRRRAARHGASSCWSRRASTARAG